MAHIKAQGALLQQISADSEYPLNFPYYWRQAQQFDLPSVQYTAREVRDRVFFCVSAVFASRIQQHLHPCGIFPRDLVWQAESGGQFKVEFSKALGDSQHVRIPLSPYRSDVETVHRLEEDEFFDLETFSRRSEFLAKVHSYQLYFNLVRPNSDKENLSPWQISQRLASRAPLPLCGLSPGILDFCLKGDGGYDVPGFH